MINININFVGMSEEDYSDCICIFKPYDIYSCDFVKKLSHDCIYSELIESAFKEYLQKSMGSTYSIEEFNMYSHQFIKYGKYLVRCPSNKSIKEISNDLGMNNIDIEIFVYGGGASLQCHGYLFIVHPDEDVHKYSPHVHVKRDDYSVRYSLDTFERYKDDRCSREFIRDEKKIIIPFLKENNKILSDFWKKAQKGYEMPMIDEHGVQYCEEGEL